MGFFEDAGVDLNEIPDDPFGFGNDFWPVRIIEVGEPKVTGGGDKYGMMVKWAVNHPKYDGQQVATQGLGLGNWTRLPIPEALQGSIPWDPKNNPEDKKVLIDLRDVFVALGFKNDEMGGVDGAKMLHRGCLVKIRAKRNDEGFWQFNLFAHKPLGDGDGANEFAKGTSNGKTAAELLEEEIANG
jgi:hypothetical protein